MQPRNQPSETTAASETSDMEEASAPTQSTAMDATDTGAAAGSYGGPADQTEREYETSTKHDADASNDAPSQV